MFSSYTDGSFAGMSSLQIASLKFESLRKFAENLWFNLHTIVSPIIPDHKTLD